MAQGDFTVFNAAAIYIGQCLVDLEADTFKFALITNVVTPVVDTAVAAWGASSTLDYDGNDVSAAGGYTANGFTLTNAALTRSVAVTKMDDALEFSLAQNGAGFTNAYWGILYSDTATAKNAIGFMDLAGPVSEVAGAITINWNSGGILTITRT